MKLIVIGSGNNSHIRLNSQFVSGYHAELLLLDNGEILLTDKGSRNGTYLNDHRLQPDKEVPIKRGDVIRFADQILDWNKIPALPMPDMSKIKEMRGIGTNFRNKYQLQGDKVSRFHATLKLMSDKKWYIQDHSKNGTTVNGRAIPPNQDVKLKKGDKIMDENVLNTKIKIEFDNPVYEIVDEAIDYTMKKQKYQKYDLVKLVIKLYDKDYSFISKKNDYREQYKILDGYFEKEYNHRLITFMMLREILKYKNKDNYEEICNDIANMETVLRCKKNIEADDLSIFSFPIENEKYNDLMMNIEASDTFKYAMAIIYDKLKNTQN